VAEQSERDVVQAQLDALWPNGQPVRSILSRSTSQRTTRSRSTCRSSCARCRAASRSIERASG
jgi:hypothetical protein